MANKFAHAVALAALLATPAFAQSTTVTTQPAAPPPSTTTTTVQTQPAQPAPSTTTVQTQPAQTQPGTQVVVNPGEPSAPPPSTRVRVRADPDVTTVETRSSVSPLQIVAVDALYGGLAGLAIGGGIALINQGNNWQRDLSIGAGVGVLAGGIFGGFDAFSRSSNNNTSRAAADPTPASNTGGSAFSMRAGF